MSATHITSPRAGPILF